MSSAKTAFSRATFQKAQSQSHSYPRTEQNWTGKKKTGEWFGIGLICNKKTLTKSNPWQLIKRKTRIHTPVQFNPIPVQNQSKEGGPTLWLFVVAFGPTQTCITCSVTKPWFLFYIFFWVYLYFPQICDAQIPDWLDSFGIYFNWQTQPT